MVWFAMFGFLLPEIIEIENGKISENWQNYAESADFFELYTGITLYHLIQT